MRIKKSGVALLVSTSLLTACSHIYGPHGMMNDQSLTYRDSTVTNTLQLPAGVTAEQLADDYPVPNPELAQGSSINLIPPGSLAVQIAAGQVPKSVLKEKLPEPNSAAVANKSVPAKLTNTGVLSNQGQALVLAQNFDQAWDKVGSALPNAGYPIVEKDKTISTYFVLDPSVTHERVTRDTPIYQIILNTVQDTTTVMILDNSRQVVDATVSQRILSDLNDALAGKGKMQQNLLQKLWHKMMS